MWSGEKAKSIATKWFWGIVAMFFVVLSVGLALALIVVTRQRDGLLNASSSSAKVSVITDDVPPTLCGSVNANNNVINLTEPDIPGPFHDLTVEEIKKLRKFLEQRPETRAARPGTVTLPSSFIFAMDLMLPKKSEVLAHLKKSGDSELPRYARVIMIRGDRIPPVVEELKCGPLHNVESCRLLTVNDTSARNPVDFSLRPLLSLEFDSNGAFKYLLDKIDKELGTILIESFNATFRGCELPEDCLTFGISPVSSQLVNSTSERQLWIVPRYKLQYPTLHPTGMAILCHMKEADPMKWTFSKVWYANKIFNSATDLNSAYNTGTIAKVTMTKPVKTENVFSTEHRRGNPMPEKPQQPPTQVEPDGKRYSLNNRRVTYLNWAFHVRMSTVSGPAVYDVRFKGERIAYEIALNEMASFYSGYAPWMQVTNYVVSGPMVDQQVRSLVPGADCPETATLISQPIFNMLGDSTSVNYTTFCLFEHNNGIPLRRHLSYTVADGGFYGGMLDSVLVLRSALTISNDDYIIDFIFHQNGVLETTVITTGYILGNVYSEAEGRYGFRIGENLLGNLHHQMFHFKVDLDVAGTQNMYKTLDIQREVVARSDDASKDWVQNKIVSQLKTSELDAVHLYSFDLPKYHIVFNNFSQNAYSENRGYRVQINGMTKSLLPENVGNERAIPWSRHQMVVTKHKDSEVRSSSSYGMYDSAAPVVNFSDFYQDNDSIVNEDLVLWITCGTYHIPRTEDLPLKSSVGPKVGFTLLPFNYHNECPSMSSRDAVYIQHSNPLGHRQGVDITRNGNRNGQCLTPESTLEKDLLSNPDLVLETNHRNHNY
ncbi:amine oxidase [copper-containing] [Biomphalaria pfeifferi]|uniref:Amine oxidase n=1 Tax=Biomphalaria pfeifferi TaxID=112525 RepID=A0AAD8B8I4_BIOPF|nr:amine oxidase [copper-containing] [Biomphalaria pfeifferi]